MTKNMLQLTKFIGRNVSLNDKVRKILFQPYSNSELQFEIPFQFKSLPNGESGLFQVKKVGIEEATDVKTLLKLVTANRNYAFKALEVLSKWSKSEKIDFARDVETDPNFPNLALAIERCSCSLPVFEIIRAIQNLFSMGISSNNLLVESLENDLLWHVQKVPFRSLLAILDYQRKYQETERQKMVMTQACQAIEQRWNEMSEARDIVYIYRLHKHIDKTVFTQMEYKMVEILGQIPVTDLVRVLVEISNSGRRPTPVLRSITHHIFKDGEVLTGDQINKVVYALSKLNFPDQALLDKLSASFIDQIGNIEKASLISAMVIVMGQMRWRDVALLDAITDWILTNEKNCLLSHFASYILTLAHLSYTPNNSSDLIEKIVPKLTCDQIQNNQQWIDIVWSLCLLGKANNEHINSVLGSNFVQNMNYSDPAFVGTLLKLMNIDAAARLEIPAYTGKFLSSIDPENLQITTPRTLLGLRKHVVQVLTNFLPPPKYMKENVRTHMGFTVDVELVVDKNGKPIPVNDYSTNFGSVESVKPLPSGASRLALMVWDFKDYTIGSHELTGANQFIVNLLEKNGYSVVHVPHFELNTRDKVVKSVQYFERIIRDTVL